MSQGLGDTTQGIPPVANLHRSDPAPNHVKFIIPQEFAFITLNLIIRRPLLTLGIPSTGDEDGGGMLHTIASIDALLTKLVESGVDPSSIVLQVGGLSQGAAISLLTGLTIAKKLAGLNKLKTMVSPHASSIPVFWAHMKADPLINLPAASFPGAPEGLDFHTYYETLAHTVCRDELSGLGSWLAKILPPLDVSV
ncbi:hypothetical protein B0H10DRAFT_2037781 [Mycena sp. CBHHK59/15]|nr:hypothetical protein B0H10DRAFT_2037781 [Mycena sp. CBHHK59/15]